MKSTLVFLELIEMVWLLQLWLAQGTLTIGFIRRHYGNNLLTFVHCKGHICENGKQSDRNNIHVVFFSNFSRNLLFSVIFGQSRIFQLATFTQVVLSVCKYVEQTLRLARFIIIKKKCQSNSGGGPFQTC